MKKKVIKEVLETYCDICGEICFSFTTIEVEDHEFHACHKFDEVSSKNHAGLLRRRIFSADKEDIEWRESIKSSSTQNTSLTK